MIEKKVWDKKKSEMNIQGSMPSQNMKDEAIALVKKDSTNLAKLRHPSILNLVEQPGEDEKFLCFITEPVEYSLACLMEAKAGGAKD